MLRTIWVWTQEWSDIPSRSAWTWAMYHQARTCSSSLTAARKLSSLRLPRVGALHPRLGDRLLRRLALGPSGPESGLPRRSRVIVGGVAAHFGEVAGPAIDE